MNSDRDTRCRVGCPIRRSRDHRSLASPPGFSQRATSFIASQCQGIHQMPFCSRLITASPSPAIPHHRRAQGQAPCPPPRKRGGGGLYEDTSLGHTRRKLCSAPPRQAKPRFAARAGQALPAPGLSASVTSQLSLHPSINAPPRSPAAVSNKLLRTSHTPWFSALRQWRLSIQLGCPCRPAKALPRRWCLSAPLRCACRAANRRFAGGGGERIRTDDLLLAKQALSQLSYTPRRIEDGRQTTERVLYRPSSVLRLVGQGGFEPPTSRLSSARSNQLSY